MKAESASGRAAMPVKPSERHVILDVLRGLALLGIALANFTEFSLYSFLPVEAAEAMPTADIDRIVRYFQYTFIDGKFYTIFSLIFDYHRQCHGARNQRFPYFLSADGYIVIGWFFALDVSLEWRYSDALCIVRHVVTAFP